MEKASKPQAKWDTFVAKVIFDYYCTLQLNGAILLSETLQIFPPLSSHHCDEPKEV